MLTTAELQEVQRRVSSELSRRSVSDVASRNSPKHSSATLEHLIMTGNNEEAYKFPNNDAAGGPPALSTGDPAMSLGGSVLTSGRRAAPPAISTGVTPIVSRRGSDEVTPTTKAKIAELVAKADGVSLDEISESTEASSELSETGRR
jgi:hypothetical protein